MRANNTIGLSIDQLQQSEHLIATHGLQVLFLNPLFFLIDTYDSTLALALTLTYTNALGELTPSDNEIGSFGVLGFVAFWAK